MKSWWQQRPAGSPMLWQMTFQVIRIFPKQFWILASIFAAFFLFPCTPRLIRAFRRSQAVGNVLWFIAAFFRMATTGPSGVHWQVRLTPSSFSLLQNHLHHGGLILVSHLGHTQSLAWILAKHTARPVRLVAARIESPEQHRAFRSAMPKPQPQEIDAWKPDAAWKILQALRSGDIILLPADRLLPGARHYQAPWRGKPRTFPSSPEWFEQYFSKKILVAALLESRPGYFFLTVENLTTPRHFVPWLTRTSLAWPYQNFDLS